MEKREHSALISEISRPVTLRRFNPLYICYSLCAKVAIVRTEPLYRSSYHGCSQEVVARFEGWEKVWQTLERPEVSGQKEFFSALQLTRPRTKERRKEGSSTQSQQGPQSLG